MKAFDDIHVQLTQKGLEKSMVHVPHRKAPLSPAILLQFRAHLNLCDSAHLAFVVCLPPWFLHFLQNSQSCPSFTWHLFFTHCIIKRQRYIHQFWCPSHHHMHKNSSVWWYCSRYSSSGHPGSPLCPMFALQSLLRTIRAPASYPLFTFTPTANQLDCITAKSLNNGIKRLASLASLDPQDFSSHSLRRGGATFAFKCGNPAELIKLQGDLADRLVLSNIVSQHI